MPRKLLYGRLTFGKGKMLLPGVASRKEVEDLFRKLKGVKLPYVRQACIYYTCLDFKNQEEATREKIQSLCDEVSEEIGDNEYDRKALFEFLTNQYINASGVAQKYYLSEKKLYKMRIEFFERW